MYANVVLMITLSTTICHKGRLASLIAPIKENPLLQRRLKLLPKKLELFLAFILKEIDQVYNAQ
jgi:hypothetical protein